MREFDSDLMSLEEALLTIETELWTGGPEAIRKHADVECVVVFAEMVAKMSCEDMARTSEKGRWRDVKMTKKGFVRLSDSAAIVSYECTAMRKDGLPHHSYISSGYVRRGSEWKLTFHQQTELRTGAKGVP